MVGNGNYDVIVENRFIPVPVFYLCEYYQACNVSILNYLLYLPIKKNNEQRCMVYSMVV